MPKVASASLLNAPPFCDFLILLLPSSCACCAPALLRVPRLSEARSCKAIRASARLPPTPAAFARVPSAAVAADAAAPAGYFRFPYQARRAEFPGRLDG